MKKIEIIGLVIGGASIAYNIYLHGKINVAGKNLDASIENLADRTPVDISDQIIEQAVRRAVDREVSIAIRNASDATIAGIRKDIEREVRVAVTDSYTDIRKSVGDEISKQVANLNIDKLKNEVKDKAKDLVIEKFEGNLDTMLEDFNKNLENVSKIYGSIAESMTKKQETVFKIGG